MKLPILQRGLPIYLQMRSRGSLDARAYDFEFTTVFAIIAGSLGFVVAPSAAQLHMEREASQRVPACTEPSVQYGFKHVFVDLYVASKFSETCCPYHLTHNCSAGVLCLGFS